MEADPYELNDLSAARPDTKLDLRRQLLHLLADTREPYFDVLMEHGAPLQRPVRSISPHPRARLSPYWGDSIEDCSS